MASHMQLLSSGVQHVINCKTKFNTPPSSSLQQCEIACTALFVHTLPCCFTLSVHLVLDLPNHRWAGVTARWAPQGHVCENEAALYTDATTHVKHVPLKEGGQLLQSTDHLFQTALCSPDPWQLAAISCQDRTQQSSLPVSPLW